MVQSTWQNDTCAAATLIKECKDAHGKPGSQGQASSQPSTAENNVMLLSLNSMLGTQQQGDARTLTVQLAQIAKSQILVDLLFKHNILG